MTKKNNKAKKDKIDNLESAEIESEKMNQPSAGNEAGASDSGKAVPVIDDMSMDDLLDDVRKSLIEDEEQNSKETKSGWWGRRSKEQVVKEPEEAVSVISAAPVSEDEQADEYVGQIDELIDMLDEDAAPEIEVPPVEIKEEPAPEPEPPATPELPATSIKELKRRAFSARDADTQEDSSEVWSVALDGAEDVFVEVEATPVDAQQDRVKALENALRPYRQYIYFLVAFLAVIVVALVSMVMYSVYQRTHPAKAAAAFDPTLPYPKALVLPGGLNFNLGQGVIVDGQWNPRGPEWLQGTEICRWVALPWSAQLEAVVGTFTQTDTIDLMMSNNDRLTYTVDARRKMTLAEMQALDQNSPCLLLVLAKQDSDRRWVVTALP